MDARHHRVSRDPDVRVVLVPYPVYEGGSPKQKYMPPPGRYPRDHREPWRPAQRPPSKAERVARFLDSMTRNDQAARDHMAEARRISAERQRARCEVEA